MSMTPTNSTRYLLYREFFHLYPVRLGIQVFLPSTRKTVSFLSAPSSKRTYRRYHDGRSQNLPPNLNLAWLSCGVWFGLLEFDKHADASTSTNNHNIDGSLKRLLIPWDATLSPLEHRYAQAVAALLQMMTLCPAGIKVADFRRYSWSEVFL